MGGTLTCASFEPKYGLQLFNEFILKTLSRSECKVSGAEKTENTRSTRKRAIVAADLSLIVTKTRKRVMWSITDMTYFELFDGDMYSTKSIATHWNERETGR